MENVLNVMADVSVQNERISGWIPSSATNVIMNGLKGSNTNHTTIGTIVFCRLTHTRACGMTVNSDMMTIALQKHGKFHKDVSSTAVCDHCASVGPQQSQQSLLSDWRRRNPPSSSSRHLSVAATPASNSVGNEGAVHALHTSL